MNVDEALLLSAPPVELGEILKAIRALQASVSSLQSSVSGLGTITAGTYTPTLTNGANVAASTSAECQYLRVQSTVVVSGTVSIDPTSASVDTALGISLPVASNIGGVEDCRGTATSRAVFGYSAAIEGDAANNRATLQFINGADVSNIGWSFIFAYQVIP